MTKDRKRPSSAVADASSSTTTSKKAKMAGVKKFYAVKVGKVPGVYETWPECQAQTEGYPSPRYKSFLSREDAEAFMAGKNNGPPKFYAVAVGNPTGIFDDWEDASKAITGVKGPKYKKFGTRAEAVAFIKANGSQKAIDALGEQAKKAKTPKATKEGAAAAKGGLLEIYTDGSTLSNGKDGARAGFGIYFGEDDPRNVSERVVGEPQTNQRAELTAIQRALEVAPVKTDVQIATDSMYAINCVETWAKNWRRNGWKTGAGQPVKNQDVIKAARQRLDERIKAGAQTTFKWVKGHADDPGNEAADALAVAGARMDL